MIDVIAEEGLVEAAEARGDRLRDRLEELRARHPIVHSLRGRGLLQGIELRAAGGGASRLPPACAAASPPRRRRTGS